SFGNRQGQRGCAAYDRLSVRSYATDYSAIKGTWLNPTSRSLVKVVIGTDSTGRLFLHAYGACSPTPCDWGTVYPAVWSGGVGSAMVKAAAATYGSSLTPISRMLVVNL